MLAHLDISKGDQEEAALGTFFSSINYSNSHNQLYEDSFIQKIWSNTLVICDSLGQASFMIIGVVTVIV